MKKVIKKTVAKAKMGTAVQPPQVSKKLTRKEKKRAEEMSKYDKGRSDKPTSYFDNPNSTRKNPTDYLKKGGAKKPLRKYQGNEGGSEVNPSFSDKVNLAAKRIGRNLTNRRAINLDNRSAKLYDKNKEKSDELYNKGDALYQKAIDMNREINKFKREKGFERSSDGTMMTKTYSKPGPIWSKQKKGGAVKKATAKKVMVKSKKK